MAISLVNSGTGGSAFGNQASVTLDVAAGNLLIVIANGPAVNSISDTATGGNTFHPAVSATQSSTCSLWYAYNIIGKTGDVITVHFASSNSLGIIVLQYSGFGSSDPLDATQSGVGTAKGTVTTGQFTTTQADELLAVGGAAASSAAGSSWTNGAGYTVEANLSNGSYNNTGEEDEIVSSIQTNVTASFTYVDGSFPRDVAIVVATFKAAGGGARTDSARRFPPSARAPVRGSCSNDGYKFQLTGIADFAIRGDLRASGPELVLRVDFLTTFL